VLENMAPWSTKLSSPPHNISSKSTNRFKCY
jgi:hypothetical protein